MGDRDTTIPLGQQAIVNWLVEHYKIKSRYRVDLNDSYIVWLHENGTMNSSTVSVYDTHVICSIPGSFAKTRILTYDPQLFDKLKKALHWADEVDHYIYYVRIV